MKNTADAKLDRLLAVAREEQIDTGSMEEFFETRIVARLRELREEPAWYTLVWRMIPLFTAVAAMVAIGAFTFSPSRSNDMFAAISGSQETIVAGNYLSGE